MINITVSEAVIGFVNKVYYIKCPYCGEVITKIFIPETITCVNNNCKKNIDIDLMYLMSSYQYRLDYYKGKKIFNMEE